MVFLYDEDGKKMRTGRMKKFAARTLAALLACSMVFALGACKKSTADEADASPWSVAETAKAAAKGAGVKSLSLPKDGTEYASGPLGWADYFYMENVAEANGYLGAAEIIVRKGLRNPKEEVDYDTSDISGDHSDYKFSWTEDLGDDTIKCFGNEDGKAMKILWLTDDYSYCILIQGQGEMRDTYGIVSDDVLALVGGIS